MSLCDTCDRPASQHPCARCCWQPEGDAASAREQLVEHAREWSHPLCTVCTTSMREGEGMACDGCLDRTRGDLAGIVLMFEHLPRHLGHLSSPGYGSRGGSGDGRPLPGGDVLALLGPGSVGNVSRFGEDYEPTRPERWWLLDRIGPLTRVEWLRAERERYGKEHLADNDESDPASVAWILSEWAKDWREFREEDPPSSRPTRPAAEVEEAYRYLERHARWAATSHPGFDDFAEDLRLLHGRLERATGLVRTPSKANAECFGCGGDLVRRLITTTVEEWWVHGAVGPLLHPRVWTGPVEETQVNAAGEEEPVWTCTRCRERYDKARYNLALGEKIEEGSRLEVAGQQYVTPALAASLFGRGEQTIRNWMGQGLLRREERGGLVYVRLGDVRRESDARPRRVRLRDSA